MVSRPWPKRLNPTGKIGDSIFRTVFTTEPLLHTKWRGLREIVARLFGERRRSKRQLFVEWPVVVPEKPCAHRVCGGNAGDEQRARWDARCCSKRASERMNERAVRQAQVERSRSGKNSGRWTFWLVYGIGSPINTFVPPMSLFLTRCELFLELVRRFD